MYNLELLSKKAYDAHVMINDVSLKLCLQLNLYSELCCVTFSQINVNIYLYWDILKSLPGIFFQH